MHLLQLTKGALVPHAPLLLPELASDETRAASASVTDALGAIGFDAFDLIIIVSPHGHRSGVYCDLKGSLVGFGYPTIGLEGSSDRVVAARLADSWGQPLLDEPIDHGILVPLAMTGSAVPVVGLCFRETTEMNGAGTERVEEEVCALVSAIQSVHGPGSVLFVASANDSAGLTARSPLTEVPGASRLRDELIDALLTDVSQVEDVALRLAADSGSCGLAPLLCLARLFSGCSAEVLAKEQPVGVGYTVAVTHE